MDIKRLNDLMGNEPAEINEYKLPRIHSDEVACMENVTQYGDAKRVLEFPEINSVLKEMKAFETLVENDIDSYTTLAANVRMGISRAVSEGTLEEDYGLPVSMENPNEEILAFTYEFVMEHAYQTFCEGDAMDMPKQSGGMMQKIMDRLGIRSDTLDLKDMLYMYLFQRYLGGRHDVKDSAESLGESFSDVLHILLEKAPPGMEGWIMSVKKSFMDQYGDDWEEALYSTAWKKYNEGRTGEVTESEEAKCPKIPSNVTKDVKDCMKELDELITKHKARPTFDTYKPSFYNAKKALELIMSKCKGGTMVDYKWAQIHFSRLKSPVTDYFPASLIKYLSHGGGEEDTLKSINENQIRGELDDLMKGMDIPNEPEAEDYVVSDSGRLGAKYSVSQYDMGHLGEFDEWDEAIAFIKDKMERDQFYPDVWYVDDHGGIELVRHWED
jgi:hypothetical protein